VPNRFFSYLRHRMLAAPIGAMFAGVLVLGLIPAFVMGGLFVKRGLADVAVIESELRGIEVVKELKPLEAFVINPPDIDTQRSRWSNEYRQRLNNVRADNGNASRLKAEREFANLDQRLKLIANGVEGVDARTSYDALMKRIGNQSGLILDPELDTYYLMTITLHGSRDIAEKAHDLSKAYASAKDRADPVLIVARHNLANAALQLKIAANTAVESSRYDMLGNGNFLKSVNSTISAANRMNAAFGGDVATARLMVDQANATNWEITTFSLETLLRKRHDDAVREIWISITISGIAAIFVIIFASFVIVSIADGVRQISGRLHDLADGDFLSPVPGTRYRNDIGIIANALQDFIGLSGKIDEERAIAKAELEQTVARVRDENEVLIAAAVEQQRKMNEQERSTLSRLARELEDRLGVVLQGSHTAAEKMDVEAAAMADRSSEVKLEASRAVIVATEIRESVNPVPETVRGVASSLSDYTNALSEARRLAAEAQIRVHGANLRMSELTQATEKAADMLSLITQVAQKTNMLALNAAIEAVRVGEAGKGFEVVANEVKSLAVSTRVTATDISHQIEAMEVANREVALAFAEIMQIVETLAHQSANVADGMNDQTAAIGQVHHIVANAVSELSKMVISIESADRSASASRDRSIEMLQASKGVSENVGDLDNSVRTFLREVQESRPLAA
jgi:methyl-accepting chemotaxis protein